MGPLVAKFHTRTIVVRSEVTEDQLIADHIVERPHGVSRADARIADNGMHVWALIGYLRGVNGDGDEAARAYRLSSDAMAAALAFYRRYQEQIDARLLLNDAAFDE